ncbi:hypothetical protein L210DRAFT_3427164, partial [Boletus edulis BED1]
LGEFTVPSLTKFSPSSHITPSHVSRKKDHKGLDVVALHLPRTKCSAVGEDMQCAPIVHLTNLVAWLDNHFCVNTLDPNDHLFAWKHHKGLCSTFCFLQRPLMKTEVTNQIKDITSQFNLPDLKGHSLRIGGTLHYLLQGTPFDVVKTMGRWSGESFTLYLRRHVLILAPYLHERTDMAAEQLTRSIMLPVH